MNSVAEKVRRLLALANSPNVHEAAAAAAEAQRLMQVHKLTAADVEADDGSKITEVPLGAEGFMASWKFALVGGVARAFFCEAIAMRAGQTRRVRIVGKRDDADVAKHVFEYLVKEIERLADADADTPDARYSMRAGNTAVDVYKEKFRQGAAHGVVDKLKEETEKFTRSDSKALVLVRDTSAGLRDYLRKKYGESRVFDREKPKTDAEAEAFIRGYDKGRDVAVPRVGGAEKYLPGEVGPPPQPVDDFYDDYLDTWGDFRSSVHRSGFEGFGPGGGHEEEPPDSVEERSDLSRGRGGRTRDD